MRFALALCATLLAGPALAEAAWDDIRHALYGDRVLRPGADLVQLDAPYRTDNDVRTVIGANITAPADALISKVTLVLDENPMPVSAVFSLSEPQPAFGFSATLRINGPTPIHVIAEATDGEVYVVESYVKTSGLGACAAPPGTDPVAALESLGEMELVLADPTDGSLTGQLMALATDGTKELSVDIQHPSHSGMQKDQISLLYIPMRYVSDLDIGVNGAPYAGVTGSISMSENPSLTLSVPGKTQTATVRMTDTDGTVTEATTATKLY